MKLAKEGTGVIAKVDGMLKRAVHLLPAGTVETMTEIAVEGVTGIEDVAAGAHEKVTFLYDSPTHMYTFAKFTRLFHDWLPLYRLPQSEDVVGAEVDAAPAAAAAAAPRKKELVPLLASELGRLQHL